MEITLEQLIKLVNFTSGRRIFALRKVRDAASAQGDTELVERIDAALADDRETRALDNRWVGSKGKPSYGPEVPEIDNWVDQLLTSIRDAAASFTKGAFAGTQRRVQAERVLGAVFPAGVQAITSLPYVDQVAAVEVMLDQLRGPQAADVAALGLTALVDRLAELTEQYRTAVDRGRQRLEFATVQAARKRGQRNLLEVVAMILGRYYSHTDSDHVHQRAQLLAPVLEQDRAIRAIVSARRSVPDIDPDAPDDGEVTDGTDAPAQTPASPEAEPMS